MYSSALLRSRKGIKSFLLALFLGKTPRKCLIPGEVPKIHSKSGFLVPNKDSSHPRKELQALRISYSITGHWVSNLSPKNLCCKKEKTKQVAGENLLRLVPKSRHTEGAVKQGLVVHKSLLEFSSSSHTFNVRAEHLGTASSLVDLDSSYPFLTMRTWALCRKWKGNRPTSSDTHKFELIPLHLEPFIRTTENHLAQFTYHTCTVVYYCFTYYALKYKNITKILYKYP